MASLPLDGDPPSDISPASPVKVAVDSHLIARSDSIDLDIALRMNGCNAEDVDVIVSRLAGKEVLELIAVICLVSHIFAVGTRLASSSGALLFLVAFRL